MGVLGEADRKRQTFAERARRRSRGVGERDLYVVLFATVFQGEFGWENVGGSRCEVAEAGSHLNGRRRRPASVLSNDPAWAERVRRYDKHERKVGSPRGGEDIDTHPRRQVVRIVGPDLLRAESSMMSQTNPDGRSARLSPVDPFIKTERRDAVRGELVVVRGEQELEIELVELDDHVSGALTGMAPLLDLGPRERLENPLNRRFIVGGQKHVMKLGLGLHSDMRNTTGES